MVFNNVRVIKTDRHIIIEVINYNDTKCTIYSSKEDLI